KTFLHCIAELWGKKKTKKRAKRAFCSQLKKVKMSSFNNLSDKSLNQLKEKIDKLGILKTENLTESVITARINYPRAYESWTDKEKKLLAKAIKYTNDLELLSECFQRGKVSIESYGQRIIYESQNLENKNIGKE